MATQTLTATLGQHWFDETPTDHAQATTDHNTRLFHAQSRARRGPTPEVFFVKHLDNTRLVKADDPVRKKEMRNFAIAMSILFVMAMVYGWQHFNAIEYGYKVEAKKAQLEQLRETNRQLSLQEAQLCDLGRLDKEARRLGMDAPKPGQVVGSELSPDVNSGAVLAEAHIPNL
jgi:hypothetical protein